MFPTFYASRPTMCPVSNTRETPGDRLRRIRTGLKLSAREAERLSDPKVTHSNIGKIENGHTEWENVQLATIRGLARAYGMTYEQLIREVNGTDYPPKPNIYNDQATLMNPNLRYGTRKIPKYDWVGMGPGGRDAHIIGYVDVPESWSGEYVSYDARGDSMLPHIADGTELIIRLQDAADWGEVVLCYAPEEGTLLKVLSGVTPDGYYVLTSFNTGYEPILASDVKIYGILWETRTAWKANGRRR